MKVALTHRPHVSIELAWDEALLLVSLLMHLPSPNVWPERLNQQGREEVVTLGDKLYTAMRKEMGSK